jgi:hypothetical protein
MIDVENRDITIDFYTLTNKMTMFSWSIIGFELSKEFLSNVLKENDVHIKDISNYNFLCIFKTNSYVKIFPIRIVSNIPFKNGYRVIYRDGKMNEGGGY